MSGGKPTSHLLDSTSIEDISILGKRKGDELAKSAAQAAEEQKKNECLKIKKSLQGQVILEEDEYTNKLHDIIQRDFFPELSKIRDEYDYRVALEGGDVESMKDIAVKYLKSTEEAENNEPESPKLGLDAFQARYTGEDNASFDHIIKQENEKKREKYKWVYNSNRLLDDKKEGKLLIEDSSFKQKPQLIEYWNHDPKNALMYFPQSKRSLLNEKSLTKEILYENTRIPKEIKDSFSSNNDTKKDNKIIQQIPGGVLKDALFKMKEGQFMTPAIRTNIPSNTPSVGYEMVSSTPAIEPQKGGATPILTWGVIESTPMLIETREDSKPLDFKEKQFKLPELRKKEELAIRLANESARWQVQSRRHAPSPLIANSRTNTLFSKEERIKLLTPSANPQSTYTGFQKATPSPFIRSSNTPVLRKKDNK